MTGTCLVRRGGAVFLLVITCFCSHLAIAFTKLQTRRSMHSVFRLNAKWRRGYFEEEDGSTREKSKERPTLPTTELIRTPTSQAKPKIIVLGASGKIGSLTVRQLLEMSHLDATIVAFVRDYDKACRVLYDDMLAARVPKKKNGPKLEIVVGDLVPPEELPGFQDEDEEVWLQAAQSAASFYGNDVHEYDNRELQPDVNEVLQDAIKGCTTIISCVGSVRTTNWWSDFIVIPLWRLFRHDVSGWCRDPRHPYYVHYATTRKVLGYAEREQLRREAAAAAIAEEDETIEAQEIPRIRFIRVSDLCVTQKPWGFVPLVTNMMHSMVFRYQDMAERLLEESKVLDTVILRPGDLVDDERDENTTSLHVSASGTVPCPARVGREDVAELAIAAAMFKADNITISKTGKLPSAAPPLHLSLGVRWAGEDLGPYPPQGKKRDGLPDAHQCMNKALKEHRQNLKRKRRKRGLRSKEYIPESIVRFANSRRRSLKPYGVFVAFPVYFLLLLFVKNLCCYLPGHERITPLLARARNALGASVMARMPSIQTWLRRSQKSYISF